MPAGDVHERLGAPKLVGDARQRLGSVDEELDASSRSRRRLAACPASGGGIEGMLPTQAPQSAPMVAHDQLLDTATDGGVGPDTQSPRSRRQAGASAHRGIVGFYA